MSVSDTNAPYLTRLLYSIKNSIIWTFHSCSHAAITSVVTAAVTYEELIVTVYFPIARWKLSFFVIIYRNRKHLYTLSVVRNFLCSPLRVGWTHANFNPSSLVTSYIIWSMRVARQGMKSIFLPFTCWIFLFTELTIMTLTSQSEISTYKKYDCIPSLDKKAFCNEIISCLYSWI